MTRLLVEVQQALSGPRVRPYAEHLGHLLAWSVQRGDTVQKMLDSAFYYAVIEEGLRTALRQLQGKLARAVPAVERCLNCAPVGTHGSLVVA